MTNASATPLPDPLPASGALDLDSASPLTTAVGLSRKVDVWPRQEPRDRAVSEYGPYRVIRELGRGHLTDRLLAVHVRDHTSHVIHRFDDRLDRAAQRRFASVVAPLLSLSHPHLLTIQHASFLPSGSPWLITPYTGNQDGLLTLSDHIRGKGGRLAAFEVQRVMVHLLEGAAHAHERGIRNGPFAASQVLVDRHGSLAVELYGLSEALSPAGDSPEQREREEIRTIAALGYRMISGCRPRRARDGRLLAVSVLAPGASVLWNPWFEAALSGKVGARRLIETIPPIERPVGRLTRQVRALAARCW